MPIQSIVKAISQLPQPRTQTSLTPAPKPMLPNMLARIDPQPSLGSTLSISQDNLFAVHVVGDGYFGCRLGCRYWRIAVWICAQKRHFRRQLNEQFLIFVVGEHAGHR